MSKKEKKALLAAQKAAGGDESPYVDAEGDVAEEVASMSLGDDGGAKSAAGAGDAATIVSDAGSGAAGSSVTGSLSKAAGDGSTVVSSALDNKEEEEEMGGEHEHQRLMKQAMDRINYTTSTYQEKIHPNARDIRVSNLTVILKGKVGALHAGQLQPVDHVADWLAWVLEFMRASSHRCGTCRSSSKKPTLPSTGDSATASSAPTAAANQS